MKALDKQVGGSHYKDLPIQPVDYIVQNGLEWREGNIVKYITRHHQKGKKKDIEKVIHYAQMLLEEYDQEKGNKFLYCVALNECDIPGFITVTNKTTSTDEPDHVVCLDEQISKFENLFGKYPSLRNMEWPYRLSGKLSPQST